MQFTYLALFSLISLALATPVQIVPDLAQRQATQTQPAAEAAAMSNSSGDVVSFNTADVYTPPSSKE